jgi:hypothetical protein
MPQANRFRHQAYTSALPASPHHLLNPSGFPVVGSPEFKRRMREVGEVFRANDVAAIYLAHGTFVGLDAFGILTELGRLFPSSSRLITRMVHRLVDRVANEEGNYTESFARCFEGAINRLGQRRIPVRLFHWSSENHHLGRADGAVRLIDELASRGFKRKDRVLLWGHSHAGNLFALMTNLLAGHRETVEQFFQAAAIYYRWPLLGLVDIPVWRRVHDLLTGKDRALSGRGFDLVTFGTPIRYGWDSDGYGNLLHFVYHRPVDGMPDYRAAWPPRWGHVVHATHGDYVQQLGIAGTNVVPSVLAWRAWLADRRLNALLQAELPGSRPLDRFEAGAIVPDEGTTLLVDYGQQEGTVLQHLAGHAMYTRKEWLLFHAEEVARRFYAGYASMVA